MKTLDYYVQLPPSNSLNEGTYLSLIQQDISGGRIRQVDIDIIRQFPNATEISISGLTQDTFEYFVQNYGHQFRAIIFWKCPLVNNLEMMELLHQVEYVVYFWNQRAETLWDFSKTKSLKGFCYDDFTRMHDISQVSSSPSLEEFHFGNRVWSKYVLRTLEPLARCKSLKSLSFSAKKILDERVEPLGHLQQLERLYFGPHQFTTEQVAWLKAHLPNTVTSNRLQAYWTLEKPLAMNGKNKDTFILGKRKPFLDSVLDRQRIQHYEQQFMRMYQWFLQNPTASPEDYRGSA